MIGLNGLGVFTIGLYQYDTLTVRWIIARWLQEVSRSGFECSSTQRPFRLEGIPARYQGNCFSFFTDRHEMVPSRLVN